MTTPPPNPRNIVVATADTLSTRMAGPAIRALRVARALAAEHNVRLVTTGRADLSDDLVSVETVSEQGLRRVMDWCDVFVFQGWILAGRPYLSGSDKVLVADIYDPMHLEQLEQGHESGSEDARWQAVADTTTVLNEQLLRGDFLMCASARQRDFWLGQLAALGRINPATYDEDESLGRLVAVVPFGVDEEPPRMEHGLVKGVIPGIGVDDRVVLWGGGIYNWFDPLTLIRAIDRLRQRLPDVRLVFMGLRHPNPEIPTMRMAHEARQLADTLAITGTHVFFNDAWVPFAERARFLLDADVGVSTHLHHVETEFSYRTRILDYFWAGLPVVSTGGDALGALIEERALGLTVPPGDVDALERALERLLCDDELIQRCRANIATIVPELHWSVVLAPLIEFCRSPRRAPDLADPDRAIHLGITAQLSSRRGLRADTRLALRYLRDGGVPLLVARARSRLRRKLRGRAVSVESRDPPSQETR